MSFNNYLRKTFSVMAVGIFVSTLFALLGNIVLYQFSWMSERTAYRVILGMSLVELLLVILFSKNLRSMDRKTAFLWFGVYSAMSGFTMSYIFSYFLAKTIIAAFISAASVFIIMAIAGYFTKIDVYKTRGIVCFSLITLLIVEIVNIFIGSTFSTMIISAIGIFLFAGIIIYDMNDLRRYYEYAVECEDNWTYVCYGAFQLYLDFINIFLRFLNIFSHNSSSKD